MAFIPNNLMFASSDVVKNKLTKQATKDVSKLYSDWANEVKNISNFYATKQNASVSLTVKYYNQLQKQLEETSKIVANEAYSIVKDSAYQVSHSVVKDAVEFASSIGLGSKEVGIALSHVPDSVVKSLVTGSIYDSSWSLSKSIWSDNEKVLKDVYVIVGQGRAMQESVFETAKKLERYVNPNKVLRWSIVTQDGAKVYKNVVDYNAQRLVRTLNQHAYQQTIVETSKKNPFVGKIKWVANGSRVCHLCAVRDGVRYDKDKLPLDHPNGMCTMVPETDSKAVDKIAAWVKAKDGAYSDIDEYVRGF